MSATIPVNFHTHSIFSDGDQTPEALAANLSRSGVRFASLTDHDTTEGLLRFETAAKKLGLLTISGVEISTWLGKKEIHLLAYGFDTENLELQDLLLSIRQTQSIEVHSVAGSIRKLGSNNPRTKGNFEFSKEASNGKVDTNRSIKIIHHAGGKVFLAHPLHIESDLRKLEKIVSQLKDNGLDGIEAIYDEFTEESRYALSEIAKQFGLLISAGTDIHANNGHYSIEMPFDAWRLFRDEIINNIPLENTKENISSKVNSNGNNLSPSTKHHAFQLKPFFLRILLPTLFALGLFLAALWGVIFPSFEQTLMDRKKELIRELTQSAWSILVSFEQDEQAGLLTRQEAQDQAIAQISKIRYGPEGKDYFWLQDLHPRMLMHPYRPDLNGQDVSTFTDLNGTPIFVEFANLVKKSGEGYVDYVWQWKDDPTRLEPKQSYVKGFAPWGWVIGTGIYLDDVHVEISRLEKNSVIVSLIISGAVVLILLFVLQQSLRIEKARQEVLDSLNESTEKYHSLSEATTEGTLLIMNDRCRYANQTFLAMTGYNDYQIEFLELVDFLPRDATNEEFWKRYDAISTNEIVNNNEPLFSGVDGSLRCMDDSRLDSVLLLNPITFSNQRGYVLIAKKLLRDSLEGSYVVKSTTAQYAPVGMIQVRNNKLGTIEEMNLAAEKIFFNDNPHLADLFPNLGEYDEIRKKLEMGSEIKNHQLFLHNDNEPTRIINLSLKPLSQEGSILSFIGILEDITEDYHKESIKNNLIEKMQASLLFLHEPLINIPKTLVLCDLHASISEAAKIMSDRGTTATLITSGKKVIGIFTEHDLHTRVVTDDIDLSRPVHEVMSAPVVNISESSPIYEALSLMEEKNLRHLAVVDSDGQFVNIVDVKTLMQFQSYGMVVLNREIDKSITVDEVIENVRRIPLVAGTLQGSSTKPRHVTNLLSSIADSATSKIIQLSIKDLGKPPIEYAFINMGSQGRQEPTLATDQDNGIIYLNPPENVRTEVSNYFHELGNKICDGLARAGYPYCAGLVMANNPIWCRSLSEWITTSRKWITIPEPQEVLNLSIFFDFRMVEGNRDIVQDFRTSINSMLEGEPAIFHFLAESAVKYTPPTRLLGNVYIGSGDGGHAGEVNLKDIMMPIVSFSRLYSLRHKINSTNTMDRLESLFEKGIISQSSLNEIMASYEFLMQLRLTNQLLEIKQKKSPTNIITLDQLGYMQKEQLKQALIQISVLQKMISYDFLGGL